MRLWLKNVNSGQSSQTNTLICFSFTFTIEVCKGLGTSNISFSLISLFDARFKSWTVTSIINHQRAVWLQQESIKLWFVTDRHRHYSSAQSASDAWWIGRPQGRWQAFSHSTAIINHTHCWSMLIFHTTIVTRDECRAGGLIHNKTLLLLSSKPNLYGCYVVVFFNPMSRVMWYIKYESIRNIDHITQNNLSASHCTRLKL